jgi:hypothetical protein
MTPKAFGEDERLVRCFATEMVGTQGGRLAGLMVPERGSMVPGQGSMVPGQGLMVPGQGLMVPVQESTVVEEGKKIVAVRVGS